MRVEILILIVAMFLMFAVGFIAGENFEDKRVCSAWYEGLNLTAYQGLVFDNETVTNFTINTTRR